MILSLLFTVVMANTPQSPWSEGDCIEVQEGVLQCNDEKQVCYIYEWKDVKLQERFQFGCQDRDKLKSAEVK